MGGPGLTVETWVSPRKMGQPQHPLKAGGVVLAFELAGVRMALGARAGQGLRMVLGEAMGLALIGIGAGLCASMLFTRLLNSMLFGLNPPDALTLAGAVLLLSAAAMLAGWVPAWKASRMHPVQALRHE